MTPRDRIIVALDGMGPAQMEQMIKTLAPYVGTFKVGLEAISTGDLDPGSMLPIHLAHQLCRLAEQEGSNVFWDGKWEDIPNTMHLACAAILKSSSSRGGIRMVNLHATSGGEAIQKVCVVAHSRPEDAQVKVLAVTVLTSLGFHDLEELGLVADVHDMYEFESEDSIKQHQQRAIEALVVKRAQYGKTHGADGAICSPHEITAVREVAGSDFLIVTPGVRPAGASHDDQKRVMTPGEAVKLGADYLVIGRPITKPESGTPVEAAQRIAEEIDKVAG